MAEDKRKGNGERGGPGQDGDQQKSGGDVKDLEERRTGQSPANEEVKQRVGLAHSFGVKPVAGRLAKHCHREVDENGSGHEPAQTAGRRHLQHRTASRALMR